MIHPDVGHSQCGYLPSSHFPQIIHKHVSAADTHHVHGLARGSDSMQPTCWIRTGLTFFSGVVCFGSRRAMGTWASRHYCRLVPDHSHLGKQRHFQTQSTQPQSCFLWLLPCQNSAWRYRIAVCTSNSSQQQTRTVLGLGTPLQVCTTGMTWSADLQ